MPWSGLAPRSLTSPANIRTPRSGFLSIVELDLAQGQEAARQAAIAAFAELAMSENARESIASFLQRGRRPV